MRSLTFAALLCGSTVVLSACSGGQSGSAPATVPSATPPATPASTPSPTPTATPVATPTATASPKPTNTPVATPTATPVATPTAKPTATPSPPGSPAAERAGAQAVLSILRPMLLEDQLQQGVQEQAATQTRRRAAATCDDAVEYSSTQNGGMLDFTLDFFYDAACTMPWETIVGQEVETDAGENFTATATVDGTNGALVEYDAITGELNDSETESLFAFTATTGPSMSSQTGHLGADCKSTLGFYPDTETCSFGSLAPIAHLPGSNAAGTVLSENSTVTDSTGSSDTAGSGPGTFDTGKAPPMALANDDTNVSITGSSQQKTLASTENLLQASGATPAATCTVTDSADGVFVTVSLSGYTFTGSVEDATTKSVEATFTTDVNGFGTITYSNGKTAPIAAFVTQG